VSRSRSKRLAAAVLVLGVTGFLVALASSRRSDARRLDAALAALDAEDPGWRVDGVVAAHNAAVPADDTANVTEVMFAALALRPPSHTARWAALSARTIPGTVWDNDRLPRDGEFCSLHEVYLDEEAGRAGSLKARHLAAGGMTFHFSEPNPFPHRFTHQFKVRYAASMLLDAATVDACFGRGEEALQAAESLLHLVEVTLATEPFWLSQNIRRDELTRATHSVQQTLAWTEPSAELANLQAAFTRAIAVDGVTTTWRGERAVIMRTYDNVRAGELPADYFDRLISGPTVVGRAQGYRRRLAGRSLVRDQAEVLRTYNALLVAAQLSGPARRDACNAVVSGVSPGLAHFFEGVRGAVVQESMCQSRMLCAALGLACERYRRQFGRWPVSLAELPVPISPAAPLDPLTREPFAYQVVSDGAIVFSVSTMAHLRTGFTDDDITLLNRDPPAKFRLWNPESRRRPAGHRYEVADPPPPPPGDAP